MNSSVRRTPQHFMKSSISLSNLIWAEVNASTLPVEAAVFEDFLQMVFHFAGHVVDRVLHLRRGGFWLRFRTRPPTACMEDARL